MRGGFLYSLIVWKCAFGQISPQGKTAMQEAMLGEAGFKLRIHAPQQSTTDVLEALDSLLKIEEATRKGDEEDYVAQKQRLLQIHKNRIRDIVQAAFEPIQAMLPNPVSSVVAEELRPVTAGRVA